jgi:hypothetical protein
MDVTYQDKLNELRLDITHPKSRGKVFVCLEGESDVKLFRKFFNLEQCKVERIPGGKFKLEECVTRLVAVYRLILGIRDADFLHLENKTSIHPNIFLTDCHDMEMKMISVEEVFSSILFEFTNIKQEEHGSVRDNILKAISFIGYFKLLNEIEKLEINFDGIDFDKLIDIQTFEIDKNKLIDTALRQSPNAKERDTSILLAKINSLINVSHDLYQLCNGHDFMKVLSNYINRTTTRKIKYENLESQFRTTYTLQHYQSTNLYKNTLNWATENNCKLY